MLGPDLCHAARFVCVREGGFEKTKGNMFKDRTYVKDRTIFVSPESCVSEGYSEKEIFLDNPVVVSSV